MLTSHIRTLFYILINSILSKIFISCHIITIFISFYQYNILYYIHVWKSFTHSIKNYIICKNTDFLTKLLVFYDKKPHCRGGMFTFFNILSISVNTLGVQLTPHVQNFKTPSSSSLHLLPILIIFPISSKLHQKASKIHKMSSRTSSSNPL